MAQIMIGAVLLLTFHFLSPVVAVSETIMHFDGFFRQIRQFPFEVTPESPEDFIKHAEMALFTTGKIFTLIDWAYETNLTESNRNSKTAFKVYTYSYETSITNGY